LWWNFFFMSGSWKRCWISLKMVNIIYQKRRVGSGFNRVIELNQKILILKRFVSKNDFLCDDNWILYKIFCSIELCCSWRFDEKLFVFKYCFIFIVLGLDTSTPVSKEGTHRCHKGSTGSRGLSVCRGQWCNWTLSKTKTIKY
jgi:hypothetical protein